MEIMGGNKDDCSRQRTVEDHCKGPVVYQNPQSTSLNISRKSLKLNWFNATGWYQ